MTEFSIYQINTDRDDNRVRFLGLDTLERFQRSKEVDPVLYDRVYDGKLDCNSLETIYEKFNVDHPADYKGRSLSVSDVAVSKIWKVKVRLKTVIDYATNPEKTRAQEYTPEQYQALADVLKLRQGRRKDGA